MNEITSSLFARVDSITGRVDWEALNEIAKVLSELTETRAVRQALCDWITLYADTDRLGAMARETSTHYVWPLHYSSSGYGVAVNEFKPCDELSSGYATTLHNHRYSFVSLMLSGGYVQVRSAVNFIDRGHAMQICDLGEDTVTEGDIVTIGNDEFHRLVNIMDHTVTLVVKCPPVKRESLSVDTRTMKVTRHVPAEARVSQLMNALAEGDEWRR